ncbi:hypothetical protein COO60DRAFT_1494657 [Scenedesmus sp. NREL 46B-D3]|nr:hypothetical protein COO60DRAFT_1494657 [Scenedesmus sp. NREL 46B-D3]
MAVAVGIIGAGTSATVFHAPFICSHPSFRLQKFLRTASRPVAGYETVPVTDNIASFLPGIDLAVVTTPTHTHYALAKTCLEAGKHVILEKPMAVSHAECLELCELAGSKDRLLAVYQNRRWDGDFQLVRQLLACGALGRLVEYESHFDRFRNAVKPGWKEEDLPGSGVLYDLGERACR